MIGITFLLCLALPVALSWTALSVSLDKNQWPLCKYTVCVQVPNKVNARNGYIHMLIVCNFN